MIPTSRHALRTALKAAALQAAASKAASLHAALAAILLAAHLAPGPAWATGSAGSAGSAGSSSAPWVTGAPWSIGAPWASGQASGQAGATGSGSAAGATGIPGAAGTAGAATTAGPRKDAAPIPTATLALMAAKNTTPAAPILVRTFKKEAELEVWKKARTGQFVLLKTFPICRWSGQLGPKVRPGDRQTPEGFYAVARRQMNPNSAYYLSFDVGFPNAYDRAHGASGSHLMVHGTCSSAGCYAMTDAQVGEIYAIAREAFAGGQQAFQFQAYPFRMTAEHMARHRSDPNIGFWRQLKEGSDRFEASGEEPGVTVKDGRYVFAPSVDPAREALVTARRAAEEARIAALVADGGAAVRTTYADGGQHPSFAALARKGASLGMVSRPEALALAGREIVVIPSRPKPPACAGAACPTQTAALNTASEPARPFEATRPSEAAPGEPVAADEPSLFAAVPIAEGASRLALATGPAPGPPILPAFLGARAMTANWHRSWAGPWRNAWSLRQL